MAFVNLDGKAPSSTKRPKLEHQDRIHIRLVEVKDAISSTKFGCPQPVEGQPVDPKTQSIKIPFVFEHLGGLVGEDGQPLRLDCWMSAKITKGGTGSKGKVFSPSRLYELIEKSGMLQTLGASLDGAVEIDNAALVVFLRKNLIGMKYLGQIKNSNIGKDNEYSAVGDIIKKIDENAPNAPAPVGTPIVAQPPVASTPPTTAPPVEGTPPTETPATETTLDTTGTPDDSSPK